MIFTMENSENGWRCLYVRPEDLQFCIRSHVVGCSPRPPFLEVAVDPNVPITYPYQHLPDVAPIAIDSLVAAKSTNESWQGNQIQALYKFLKQAELGITTFGSEIGDYYRRRYPKVQPWIEYLVLYHDLPSSDSRKKNEALLNDFSRAVLFLVLSVADPHDQATRRLRGMAKHEILGTLRGTLHDEFRRLHRYSQVNFSTIGLVRHVLVQVGGRQNLAQINLLDDKHRDIHISSTFASLMGVSRRNISSNRNPVSAIIDQLSYSQIFLEKRVDSHMVAEMTQRLKLPFWVFVASIPNEWTSWLSSNSWRSFRAILNDASYLHQSLRQPHNAERLFTIWAYLVRHTYPGAKERVQPVAEDVWARAISSLRASQPRPFQMVLDLMTLFCIVRLFPKETSGQEESNSVESLNLLLMKDCKKDVRDPLSRLLVSLHRVLHADNFPSRDPNLARFISLVGLPNLLLDLNDSYADQYFADRILHGSGHSVAFARLCSRVGCFPVELPPLKMPEEVENQEGC